MRKSVVSSIARNALWPALLAVFLLFAAPVCHSFTDEEICSKRESLCRSLLDQGFTTDDLRTLFSDPRLTLYPEILGRKGKGLDYFGKRFGLMTHKSLERGRVLLKANKTLFADIEDRYHVEPEALVAIYRVETNFGQHVGAYPVVNSLLTLALIENRRSDWAEKELIQLLVLSRANNSDPLTIKGSWAGAFGLCQFIPSSYITYGVDGNMDGRVDLFQFTDAMASIANYLAEHGWETGHPDKMKQAVYAYNHCNNYVQAVLAYARAIGKPAGKTEQQQVRPHKRSRKHRK